MSNIILDPTDVVKDIKSLDEENTYKSAVRALTLQFLQKRLDNSNSIENAKSMAVQKIIDSLAGDADIPVSTLLRIVDTLGSQNSTDLGNILNRMAPGSSKGNGGGDTYNIFQSPEPAPAPQQAASPELYKLLDSLVQISESIAKKD